MSPTAPGGAHANTLVSHVPPFLSWPCIVSFQRSPGERFFSPLSWKLGPGNLTKKLLCSRVVCFLCTAKNTLPCTLFFNLRCGGLSPTHTLQLPTDSHWNPVAS